MSYTPKFPYDGNQLIFNSDRVLINSKSDSIFFFSSKVISLSSNEGIHFNTEKETIVNAPKIQLGINSTEPLVKGNQLYNLFKKQFSDLESVGNQLYTAVDSNGNPLSAVQTAGNTLIKSVKNLSILLEKINSKQNFTL